MSRRAFLTTQCAAARRAAGPAAGPAATGGARPGARRPRC